MYVYFQECENLSPSEEYPRWPKGKRHRAAKQGEGAGGGGGGDNGGDYGFSFEGSGGLIAKMGEGGRGNVGGKDRGMEGALVLPSILASHEEEEIRRNILTNFRLGKCENLCYHWP
jgi:hypothetical protein